MKSITIRLTAEQVHKVVDVLKGLRAKDCQSYFGDVMEKD